MCATAEVVKTIVADEAAFLDYATGKKITAQNSKARTKRTKRA